MKKYMLFMFEADYPGGGALDFDTDFGSMNDVAEYLREKSKKIEYRLPIWHVFDTELRSIVACSAWINEEGINPDKVIPESSYGGTSSEIENETTFDSGVELVMDTLSWRVA